MYKKLPKKTLVFKALLMLFAFAFSSQSYGLEDTRCGSISGFQFSNGTTSTAINYNQSYYINDLPNNFYIDLLVNGYSQSAKYHVRNLDTGQSYTVSENHLPYTFPGGNGAWNYGCGNFEIKAKLYKYNSCGRYCDSETIRFNISCAPAQTCGDIAGYQFTNGTESVAITNNGVYELDALPNNFYVDLLVDGQSESASLRLKNLTTGQIFNVGENYLPYTIPGGNTAWSYGTGDFKLIGKIFENNYCQSTMCDKEVVYFTINNTVCGQIDGFEFSNFSDAAITIVDGASYDLENLPADFNINLLTSGPLESAYFTLTNVDTGEVFNKTENVVPYTYPGATNTVWSHGCGTFQICSSVYQANYANGTECDSACLTFTITCEDPCGTIDGFEFSNFSDATVAIVDGSSYDLENLPSDFNINLLTSGPLESAYFTLTNVDTGEVFNKTENVVPYTYPGATNSVWSHGCGTFQLCTSIYTENNTNGTECANSCVTFTINCEEPCGNLDVFAFSNGSESVTITEGGEYNISDLPSDFYIDALVVGASESTITTITNLETGATTVVTDNTLPYAYPTTETSWDLGIGNFKVETQLFAGDDASSTLCDVQEVTFFLVDVLECEATSAGTSTLSTGLAIVSPGISVTVTVNLNNDAVLPNGYQLSALLTKGDDLVIEGYSSTQELTIPEVGGFYKVHTLAYNPETFNLNAITLGTTTAFDILDLIANNQICADLDEVGSPLMVIVVGSTDRNSNVSVNQVKDIPLIEKQLSTEVKIFPNPAVNQLNIKVDLLKDETLNYTMIDINGKQVLAGRLSSNLNVINTSELAVGFYILKLNSEVRNITKKIMVKK